MWQLFDNLSQREKEFYTGLVTIILLMLFAFIQVNQTWKYRRLEEDISLLERKQALIYEENKRLLGSITELESPERLIALVENNKEWGLVKISPKDVILIKGKDE